MIMLQAALCSILSASHFLCKQPCFVAARRRIPCLANQPAIRLQYVSFGLLMK